MGVATEGWGVGRRGGVGVDEWLAGVGWEGVSTRLKEEFAGS